MANDGHASGDTVLRIRRTAIFDIFLINENHIAACGGIAQAIGAAQQITPGKLVEVEVKSLKELREALETGVHIVVLSELAYKAVPQRYKT